MQAAIIQQYADDRLHEAGGGNPPARPVVVIAPVQAEFAVGRLVAIADNPDRVQPAARGLLLA